jgi:GTP-binding protein EngB required for normal cell division
LDKILNKIFELTAEINTYNVNIEELIKLIQIEKGFEISETLVIEILKSCKSKTTWKEFKTCVMTKLDGIKDDIKKKQLFKNIKTYEDPKDDDKPKRNKPKIDKPK